MRGIVESGHLVYAVSGTMYAVPFDLSTLTVRGTAVPVIVGIRRASGATNGAAQFAAVLNRDDGVSDRSGSVAVYGPWPGAERWSKRSGPAEAPVRHLRASRVSPDGRLLAVSRSEGSTSDIWTYDLSGSAAIQRLTFGGQSRFPVWSADSRRVTFQSVAGDRAIWWQAVDGGTAERLTTSTRRRRTRAGSVVARRIASAVLGPQSASECVVGADAGEQEDGTLRGRSVGRIRSARLSHPTASGLRTRPRSRPAARCRRTAVCSSNRSRRPA